jgi:predicted HTH transcriptional regulator
MTSNWDFAAIQRYITDEIQEHVSLDYKAAGVFAKSGGKRDEITRDVSAMANAAGGVIIYGVAEHADSSKRHLPERIDPVDQRLFSKEWLEQITQSIRPRIDGIIIHPIPVPSQPDYVIYVVEIPQSTTAHQAADRRYYKRFNFQSAPMEDYEIRDVMGRSQHPTITPAFLIYRGCINKSHRFMTVTTQTWQLPSVNNHYLCRTIAHLKAARSGTTARVSGR